MQQEVSKLKQEVEELKQQVKDLMAMLEVNTMPYELKEIIRNEVIKSEDSIQPLTREEIILGVPTSIYVPVNPTGTLVLKWRGKEYKIFYV